MIYEIVLKSEFSAAHRVRLKEGEKESLHGHNWLVEARITSKNLDENGMVIDFLQARELLKNVLAQLDHRNLNELPFFDGENPTAERVSRFIYENFEKVVSDCGATLISVTLWETPNCAAIFRRTR